MKTKITKSLQEVNSIEMDAAFDNLRRREEKVNKPSEFMKRIRRTAAVMGLAGALYFAPNAKAQSVSVPQNVVTSRNAYETVVPVSGSGFTPNASIEFGYAPIPPYSNVMINANTDVNGNWNGTFNAPWAPGQYNMTAIDTKGVKVNTTMNVVTSIIIVPQNVENSNSTNETVVNISGNGFTPNVHVQFGYAPIPPYTNVMIDAGTDSKGNWTGLFYAPWTPGTYNMTSADPNGLTANGTMTVIDPPPTTTLPVMDLSVLNSLDNLIVNAGGSSTVLGSIANNTRSDGINLSSTIGQVYNSHSSDMTVLGEILSNSSIPSNYTLFHGLTDVYNLNASEPTTSNAVAVNKVFNLLLQGYDYINNQINATNGTAGYQLGSGVITATATSNNATITGTCDLGNNECSISGGFWHASYTYTSGLNQLTATAQAVPFDSVNATVYLAGGSVTITDGTAFLTSSTSVNLFSLENAVNINFEADFFTHTIKGSLNLPWTEAGTSGALGATASSDEIGTLISAIIDSLRPFSGSFGAEFDAGATTPIFPTGVLAYTPLNDATFSLVATTNSTSTNGTGALQYPFLPNSNGTLTWQNAGYYDITNVQANGGNPAGVYYVNNQAFIANYDQDVLLQSGNNSWINALPVDIGGSASVDSTLGNSLLWYSRGTENFVQVGVTYQPSNSTYNNPATTATVDVYISPDQKNWTYTGNSAALSYWNYNWDPQISVQNVANILGTSSFTNSNNAYFILVDTTNNVASSIMTIGLHP